MSAYRLAWQMRHGLDGERISFRRALAYARLGMATTQVLVDSLDSLEVSDDAR